ncbi:MAG: hypothetical protein NC388_08985 [Clostridium sp.]|nr:hypothetical protein [Clostridium sp.]
MKRLLSKILVYGFALIMYTIGADCAFAGLAKTDGVDSLSRKTVDTEMRDALKGKMASSAFPVTVTVRGKAVCVESKNYQILPVYNQNGVFFSVFRLSKGVNWINGLPKGTYFINNRKVIIS